MRPLPLRAPTVSLGTFKTLTFLLFLPLMLLCCASTARAVPLVITGGTATTPIGLNNFNLNVTGLNFSFHGSNTSSGETQLCGLCQPGRQFGGTFPVRIDTILNLTYNGTTYRPGVGYVVISGDNFITLPLLTVPADYSPIVSPFSFIGRITVDPSDGSAPFTFDLTGAGTATFIFLPVNNGTSSLVQATFAFAPPPEPVPEPATLLLLGTGLAGVVAKVRRRRRQ
ncbi:MAG TPA: PEP-CTERM sorting domain-containing protein [Pyrinomonadaceae bacterium]|jgi:hypothetical protein